MAVSQEHIHDLVPFGANVVEDGATFRVWAPAARAVFLLTDQFDAALEQGFEPHPEDCLVQREDGSWAGFVRGLPDGSQYMLWLVGEAGAGLKRDPYARELTADPPFPRSRCVLRDPALYPWHDETYRTSSLRDLVIYQFHIGAFWARDRFGSDVRRSRPGRFLDVLDRIGYLRELNVNAIQPLPIQEYRSTFSLDYSGVDYFSPETAYLVDDDEELTRYLGLGNRLLSEHGRPLLELEDLRPGPNQLKVVVDICHLNGIAFILDVVYGHAGGGFDDASIYFFDRARHDSRYFTASGWAGGLVFDYQRPEVRRFLIQNALFLAEEYHADGFRYDEVTVIDKHRGWGFAQELSTAVRRERPHAHQIAEHWGDSRWQAVTPSPEGMGFDAALDDRLGVAVRRAIAQAAQGPAAEVDFDQLRDALYPPFGFASAEDQVRCIENHSVVHEDRPGEEWQPRIARLGDWNDARSWPARSRSRFAMGLLLTAPGVPMLFMGQEFLEDKNWSDDLESEGTLLWWDGLEQDRRMRDFHTFTRELIALRRRLPGLRSERLQILHVHNRNRILAFQRWAEGVGQDVVVVASLSEETYWQYEIGFPFEGEWIEVFNSDYYDSHPNFDVRGNSGRVQAVRLPLHGMPAMARLVIPANSVLVFTPQG